MLYRLNYYELSEGRRVLEEKRKEKRLSKEAKKSKLPTIRDDDDD